MSDLNNLLHSFRPPTFPGSYFFVLEGIEGSGKTTQINFLKSSFEKWGYRVLIAREPGGTIFGEKLRQAILQSTTDIHPLSEAFLFASSRAQLLHEVVLPELEKPKTIVLMDRYLFSSIAYQGVARALGPDVVISLHQHFPLNIIPHLTFYLKISVETSFSRQKQRNIPKDYFESKGKDFYLKLSSGYDACLNMFSSFIYINGELDNQSVSTQMLCAVEKRFPEISSLQLKQL